MVRRYVSLDGEILGEEEWDLLPHFNCFWCDTPLISAKGYECDNPFDESHDFVTICDRKNA